MLYLQLPLVKPYILFSRIRLSNHLLPEAFHGEVIGTLNNPSFLYM